MFPKSVADMLTFPQLLQFLRDVNPTPVVCDLLLEPVGLLMVAGGALALEVVSQAASTVSASKWFTHYEQHTPTVVHTRNNYTQTSGVAAPHRLRKIKNLRMMVRGLPQFAEEHLSSAQKRREEVRERRKMVMAALRKCYTEDIATTEDMVFTVETRNMFLREAMNNLQDSAGTGRKYIDTMLASVIELKSGRGCGPVPTWSRDTPPGSPEPPKSEPVEMLATATATETEKATTAADSDNDSFDRDSTYDNGSSGDWYYENNSSSYKESDSSTSLRTQDNVPSTCDLEESESFTRQHEAAKLPEGGAGDVHETAKTKNAVRREIARPMSRADGERSETTTSNDPSDPVTTSTTTTVHDRSHLPPDFSLDSDVLKGARPKVVHKVQKRKIKRPSPLLASKYFPSIDNIRPGHESPSATSVASHLTYTHDTQHRRPGQDDARKTKVLTRRSVYRSSAAELIEASELTRSDFESPSSDDGNDSKDTLPDYSIYDMPEMKDQLVAVVSKPLPSRGRYGTDLRTVLAEMRLRQKAERLAKEAADQDTVDTTICKTKIPNTKQPTKKLVRPASTSRRTLAGSKQTKQLNNTAAVSRQTSSVIVDPTTKPGPRRRRSSDELRQCIERAFVERGARAKNVSNTKRQPGGATERSAHTSGSDRIITSEVMPQCSFGLPDDAVKGSTKV